MLAFSRENIKKAVEGRYTYCFIKAKSTYLLLAQLGEIISEVALFIAIFMKVAKSQNRPIFKKVNKITAKL